MNKIFDLTAMKKLQTMWDGITAMPNDPVSKDRRASLGAKRLAIRAYQKEFAGAHLVNQGEVERQLRLALIALGARAQVRTAALESSSDEFSQRDFGRSACMQNTDASAHLIDLALEAGYRVNKRLEVIVKTGVASVAPITEYGWAYLNEVMK